MTFSLLARDPDTGALGGAAATGNLCVGAWVLRGRAGIGISASQGHSPSTLWGDQVLDALAKGQTTAQAIKDTVSSDLGRERRQLLVMGQDGEGSVFTGTGNTASVSELIRPDICAGGNMLASADIIEAMACGYAAHEGSFLRKLLAGLISAANAGGDVRGLMSAAILIVATNHPPIDLRIDHAADPLRALSELADRIEETGYTRWMQSLPTERDPFGS